MVGIFSLIGLLVTVSNISSTSTGGGAVSKAPKKLGIEKGVVVEVVELVVEVVVLVVVKRCEVCSIKDAKLEKKKCKMASMDFWYSNVNL